MASKTYYWCIVPNCKSTSVKTPDKIFIHVPKEPKMRKLWLNAARRDHKKISTGTPIYCCEDHFDLPNDMENWIRYNLMGRQTKKIMKKDVVPHKFSCQEDRKRAASPKPPRQAFVKRQRLDLLAQVDKHFVVASCDSHIDEGEVELTSRIELDLESKEVGHHLEEIRPSSSGSTTITYADVAVQVNFKPKFRSKFSQCGPTIAHMATSPFKKLTSDVLTSPIKPSLLRVPRRGKLVPRQIFGSPPAKQPIAVQCFEVATDTSDTPTDCTESYEPETSEVSEGDFAQDHENELLRQTSISRTNKIIFKNPRHYIGVPEDCFFIVKLLSEENGISINNILLCLKKIRLNNSFRELADDFGISVSHASKIFSKYVPIIALNLRSLIIWPTSKTLIQNLPLAFRARYSGVHSIIDALEIEIEKPSDSVKQALSWSEYKKCNTIKYLISATPDGIINYISPGYSGRISDTVLLEVCGYLKVLPNGVQVMADRGFKHIEHLLQAKGCTLIRPPSVESKKKSSKKDVMETKRIASLRIHIERTIRRLREFKFLKPHSCINSKLISLTDDVTVIAAGLINLQGPLIKQN